MKRVCGGTTCGCVGDSAARTVRDSDDDGVHDTGEGGGEDGGDGGGDSVRVIPETNRRRHSSTCTLQSDNVSFVFDITILYILKVTL